MLGKKSAKYKLWKEEWKRFNTIPNQLDVFNIGSSAAAKDFDYSLWNIQGYNLASIPQDMYYDNQILEQYIKHIKKGGTCIISLLGEDFIVDAYGDDVHSYKYYGFLERERILNYNDKTAKFVRFAPGLLDKRLIKQEIKDFIKKIIHQNKNQMQHDLQEHAKAMIKSWWCEFGWQDETIIREEQRESLERSWKILQRDIRCCIENNVKPVIVILPICQQLRDLLPGDIMTECFWKYIDKIQVEGVDVINMQDNQELMLDNCYENSIFLNEQGKKIFNLKVQERILKTGGNDDASK